MEDNTCDADACQGATTVLLHTSTTSVVADCVWDNVLGSRTTDTFVLVKADVRKCKMPQKTTAGWLVSALEDARVYCFSCRDKLLAVSIQAVSPMMT